MPYIPREHEEYALLPLCQKDGGEVFVYPSKLICEAEMLLGSCEGLFPYNFDSYEDYFGSLDALIALYAADTTIKHKLFELRKMVWKMNQKEEWSILKYLGPTDDTALGLTYGKNYYWPTRMDAPIYCGVIDDEEFTAYLYPTDAEMWKIILDPTGMAYRTIYEQGKGHLSKVKYNRMMKQIRKELSQVNDDM